MNRILRLTWLFPTGLFFVSGAAALIYQTSWQRLLVIFAGGDIQAVTLIVTAFMLGLGSGNLVGGRIADRQSVWRNLLLFGALEIGIGLWGYASKWIYYDLIWQRLPPLAFSRAASGAALIALLLPPTFLMGMSLPLLTRAWPGTLMQAPLRIGLLYGMNTIGAATGALLTSWYLLPLSGITGSLKIAACMNIACGICILPLLAIVKRVKLPPEASQPFAPEPIKPTVNLTRYLLLFALTGFIALGLEITWFRVLGVMAKPSAFTFGTLLGIFLLGMGAGALVGSWNVHRCKSPLPAFLWMQAGLSLYAGISFAALLHGIHHGTWAKELVDYLYSYEPLDVNHAITQLLDPALNPAASEPSPKMLFILYGAIPALLILPPTFLMGLSFPYLQKTVQTDLELLGRRTGWLQAANIAGCVTGTLIVGHVLLNWLGSSGTLKFLTVTGGFLGILALSPQARLSRKGGLWALLCITPLLALPTNNRFWALIHGAKADQSIHVEDQTGLASIKKVPPYGWFPDTDIVFVNGIGQSWLPYGSIHSRLGSLPAILHPNPESVAVIGLGSGDTAYSSACRKETKEVVCIEIAGTQLELLKKYSENHDYPALKSLINDPRFHHVNADGRRYLHETEKRFDIIEADALRATSAGSGILYSKEYFQMISKRLKPGGYAVTWLPTHRVRLTFTLVFPYIMDFGDMMIGSLDPIQVTGADGRMRLSQPEVQEHFRRAKVSINDLLGPYVSGETILARMVGPGEDRQSYIDIVNTDLFPRDEFDLSGLWKPKS